MIGLLAAARLQAAAATDFFSIKNENPLLRGIYLPVAADGNASAPASVTVSASVENTLNVERAAGESLFVDGEAVTWRIGADVPVSSRLRARLMIPFIRDSGGILDSPIERWHGWFGLPKGSRPEYPKNRLQYDYAGRGKVQLEDAHTGIGDVDAELGWFALDDNRNTAALWAGVEVPTGKRSALDGNGAWDTALWAHGAHRSSRWDLAAELGWVHAYGDRTFAGAGRGDSGFARAAATWEASRAWALRVQLEGQTARVEHTDIRFLGNSLSLAAGAEVRVTPRWHLEAGFVEDIAADTAPDFTFFVGVRLFAPESR